MPNNKLISINIPVHNAERFLADTLDSLLYQTYKNIEILLYDDHSTDKTIEIIEYYASRYDIVKHVATIEQRGVCVARNILLDASLGEFIAIADADDIYCLDRIELQLREIMRSGADLLGGNMFVFSNKRDLKQKKKQNFQRLHFSHDDIIKQLSYSTAIFHPTLFAKADVLKLLKYNENIDAAIDYDLLCRAYVKGYKMANIEQPVVYYRLHNSSIGSKRYELQLLNSYLAYNNYYLAQKDLLIAPAPKHSILNKLFLWSARRKYKGIIFQILNIIISPLSSIGRFVIFRKIKHFLE